MIRIKKIQCQFYQRFTSAFLVQKIGTKNWRQKVSRKKAAQRLSYTKDARNTLIKLIPDQFYSEMKWKIEAIVEG